MILENLKDFLPSQPVGIGGFKAYATVRESSSGTRMLPTSVLEDGGYANDHIVIEPLYVDMTINIADVFIEGQPTNNILAPLDNSLGSITQFIPQQTRSTLQKMSNIRNTIDKGISTISNAIDSGSNLLSIFSGSGGGTHRANFVQAMHALYKSNDLITLETKYKTYENMALESFDYGTDNETQSIEANLRFKQLQFRSLLTVDIESISKNPSGAAGQSTDPVSEKGVQGAEKETSLLGSVLGVF